MSPGTLIAVLCSVVALAAQSPSVLGTTAASNDRLYFLSSQVQPGSNQSTRAKLFSIDRAGSLRLIADRPEGPVSGFNLYPGGTRLAYAVAAADGNSLLFEADLVTGTTNRVTEIPRFSPNGRYRIDSAGWRDSATGATRSLPLDALLVANDGSVVRRDQRNLYLIDPNGNERNVYGGMRNARLHAFDATGRYVILDQGVGDYLVSVASGQEVRLELPGGGTPVDMVFSPEGDWVAMAFLSRSDIAICHLPDRQCRLLPLNPNLRVKPVGLASGAASVWLSSEGTVIFADLTKSTRNIVWDCLPWSANTLVAVPGSLVRFAMTDVPQRLLLDGQPIPWFPGDGDSAPMAQVPWEVQGPSITLSRPEHRCPFTPPQPLLMTVLPLQPEEFSPGDIPWSPGGRNRAVYGADWLLIDGNPRRARADEIVHIYATGLGPVDCDVRTGTPAPLDRLCRITATPDWRWSYPSLPGLSRPAEVLFAGLAPGLLGLYQIDVRAPAPEPGDPNRWAQLTLGLADQGFVNVWLE